MRQKLNQKKAFIGVLDKASSQDTVVEQPPERTEPIQKATIEEVPDKEITKNLETPLFEVEIEVEELQNLKEGETLLAYYPSQPVIGISEMETPPSSSEWDFPQGNIWIRAKISMSQELMQKEREGKQETKKSLDKLLPEHYRHYKTVFEKSASERFPTSQPWDHAIDLKMDFIPKDCKIYPLSLAEQVKLDEFIDENLRKGYIHPSKSPMASPFFFVAKKDTDALRPCQDYRYLNEGTIKNAYPLPLVGELLDKLQGANWFTKLDIRWGYHNVRIKEGDEWKATFKTNRRLFEPTVMFFGLCNSPATFQAMMNDIFKDYIDQGWIVIYMDDMLIFSKDLTMHRKRTALILERLEQHDLFLKAEKCKFHCQKVEFLGLVLTPNSLVMDPTKLKGIHDWPTPTTLKQVRSFLGFGNFYQRFIGKFAELARPLNDLTKKETKFEWTPERQKAFEALKQKFEDIPVLLMPNPGKLFVIESDASKFATGAVLRQQDDNRDWHPCGYISHSFNATQ